MAKMVVVTFLTLDGVMQSPGGHDEDQEGGFQHGGWLVPFADEDMMTFVSGSMRSCDGLLLGRKTYEIFASSWPKAGPDDPFGAQLNRIPKYVVSGTLDTVEWNNSRLLKGDLAAEVAKLKELPGEDIQVHGSGELARSLTQLELVDEYRLLIYPVLIGTGKRLFPEGTPPTALRLTSTSTTGAGVTCNTYVPDGRPSHGHMGVEYE